ncbi:gastrula zinc finger protein XlCGF52.1-like [Grus japonensis]|uniref:Gastrula zinc finger protein XlCGF52.1-like n=1 Tax=Grus japonensis TaxID=30415 RepID=A0ABC9XX91_GRUJA
MLPRVPGLLGIPPEGPQVSHPPPGSLWIGEPQGIGLSGRRTGQRRGEHNHSEPSGKSPGKGFGSSPSPWKGIRYPGEPDPEGYEEIFMHRMREELRPQRLPPPPPTHPLRRTPLSLSKMWENFYLEFPPEFPSKNPYG